MSQTTQLLEVSQLTPEQRLRMTPFLARALEASGNEPLLVLNKEPAVFH